MQPQEFMDFVHTLERMKCNTRHSYTSTLRHESVAEHTFRIAAMALLLEGEFPQLDMARVIKMCLVHDWGEAVTGDIPSFLKTDSDEAREAEAVDALELSLLSDRAALDAVVRGIVRDNEALAQRYRSGKARAFQAIMGKIMQATKGRAHPAIAARLLEEVLREPDGP